MAVRATLDDGIDGARQSRQTRETLAGKNHEGFVLWWHHKIRGKGLCHKRRKPHYKSASTAEPSAQMPERTMQRHKFAPGATCACGQMMQSSSTAPAPISAPGPMTFTPVSLASAAMRASEWMAAGGTPVA